MNKQFDDAEFQFGLAIALGAAYRQASDVGEALAAANRITDGDADSSVNEWVATAQVSDAAAADSASTGTGPTPTTNLPPCWTRRTRKGGVRRQACVAAHLRPDVRRFREEHVCGGSAWET